MPHKASETNSDKDSVNKVYFDFKTSIADIGYSYSEISDSYH